MIYAGVDLAWGQRSPSGLAVLDGRGSVMLLETAVTDEEIVAALDPLLGEECVVAFDAPLVVTNPTGNRPAEAALNRDFARFEAGAHPVNTGRPEFADGSRAGRLAAALRLGLDPVTGRRRAIEVYPHAAQVALFGLGRTLKYKSKPGRDLVGQRAELLRLVELLESLTELEAEPPLLLRASAPWRTLASRVAAASTKAELRRCEDPIDAVVCAYVAAYAVAHPERTMTYGSPELGCIVTPALPAPGSADRARGGPTG